MITPTWRRPFQLARCMLSVAQQDYRPLEHVIISDGPEPLLDTEPFRQYRLQLERQHPGYQTVTAALPGHDPGAWWGWRAKQAAQDMASGSLIAWTDDDDEYLPGHLSLLHKTLTANPAAGFAFSPLFPQCAREPNPGDNPGLGNVLARRELLPLAPWRNTLYDGWDLIERWLEAGTGWACAGEVTIRVHRHDDYTPGDGYP